MKQRPYRHLAHVAPYAAEPLVFLTVVTLDRRPLLANPVAHAILGEVWKRSADVNRWWVGNYLLMPDHLHLFARGCRESDRLSEWIKTWKSIASRRLSRELKVVPPFWQEDYFDRYLRSGENYSEKWSYVETNPVRAGLVARPEDWPYRGTINDLRF